MLENEFSAGTSVPAREAGREQHIPDGGQRAGYNSGRAAVEGGNPKELGAEDTEAVLKPAATKASRANAVQEAAKTIPAPAAGPVDGAGSGSVTPP